MSVASTSFEAVAGSNKGRNLILCFDGTGDNYDDSNTNVVKLYSILEKNNEAQLTYYQPGLGTYLPPGFLTKTAKIVASKLDGFVASYIEDHICGGYKFLQENYRPGDRIYIFGFSRGAYTARALTGMLHKVGLLAKDNIEQIHFAYKLYDGHENLDEARGFKRTFSRVVEVEFLGCWDTVSSVGAIFGKTLPFTRSNKIVKTFRHALALDERRAKFKPNFWQDPEETYEVIVDENTYGTILGNAWRWVASKVTGKKPLEERSATLKRADADYSNRKNTDVKEVWFAGCHGDLGGGSVKDYDRHVLGNPALRWMVGELAEKCHEIKFNLDTFALITLGLEDPTDETKDYFKPSEESTPLTDARLKLRDYRQKPTNLVLMATKRQPLVEYVHAPEERAKYMCEVLWKNQLLDLLTRLTDPLTGWGWWVLECIPLEKFEVDKKNFLRRTWRVNMGRGRQLPKKEKSVYYFHHTVEKLKILQDYKHKATFPEGVTPRIVYVEDS